MDRWLGAFRVHSSALALCLLVLGNLVPIAGVLWGGWDVWTILVLYWLENGIVGILTIPKILLARGTTVPAGLFATLDSTPIGLMGRGAIAGFFCFHYGIFWLVHGLFVFTFLPLMTGATFGVESAFGAAERDWSLLLVAGGGLAVSHVGSFVLNFLGRREYLRESPAAMMAAPYGRLVILHLTILAGGLGVLVIGAPLGALLALVGVKTVLDVRYHLREHRERQMTGTPAPA